MPRRVAQLESTLQKTISQVISIGLADPRVRGLVSVTSVTLTEDRHTAIVNISVLPADHAKLTLQALRHARRHLRTLVRDKVHVRPVPHLDFRLDESLKKQAEVLAAIRESVGPDDGDLQNMPAEADELTSDANDIYNEEGEEQTL